MKLRILAAAAVAFAFSHALPANAEQINVDLNFAWLSVGTGTTINEGHTFWVGEFSGTNVDAGAPSIMGNSASKCPAWFDIDFPNNKSSAGGYCITTLTTGDSLYISWHCEGALTGATMQGPYPFGKSNPCNGVSTVTSGTGKLAKATGGNTFLGSTVLFHPDGKGSGISAIKWNLTIP